jgi:glucose-6-phosphate 1-dehydrogenase
LFHLFKEHQMPAAFRIIGFARREKTDETWRAELRAALNQFSRTKAMGDELWNSFAEKVSYCQGDLTVPTGYLGLRQKLESYDLPELRQNRLFYLATSPSQFAPSVEHLHQSGLLGRDGGPGWQRLVVEKPFGHDLASAQALNAELTRFVREQQTYRIDHYLGKETVQNIMLFRFANSLFERVWHRDMVDHVQITVSEKVGVGGRGGYYEEAGALRDMVQNHLLQVLALVAMEPPVSLDAEAIRDEKVKLLKSVRLLQPEQVAHHVVRGQYAAARLGEESQSGYRQEPRVNPESNVETFVAMKLFIDNWRWSGVPFYLRTGKCLPVAASEVRVQFRPTPSVLFAAACGPSLDSNALTLRLQPQEGITLRFNGKIPGAAMRLRPVRMHFSYDAEFGAYTPEAYERLLLDAMAGDATLFIRRDEVEAAWRIADAIREGWGARPLAETEFYPAGTWGPTAADELLKRGGRAWHNPQPVS